ncbi:LRR receptor-like serine/threonine-protein kinase RGI5 [Vigna angularis]|uniref:LRR receptor-like serine/threonine-protein kinase RGI5 n=1 Tax=Phaseolus angularis TaxID=3914 RepID=UPI000809CB03|nr:LRR receptor-like serine/threonine-protein kinase RGI5 [Vigna angularis]
MNVLSSLQILDLSQNLLKSSPMLYWLSNFTTNLLIIDISSNLLESPIPGEFGKAMNSLEYLSLSNNKLQGKVPSFFGSMSMGTLVKLEALVLRNNSLMGQLPSSLKNCNNLIMLDELGDRILHRLLGLIRSITTLATMENGLSDVIEQTDRLSTCND